MLKNNTAFDSAGSDNYYADWQNITVRNMKDSIHRGCVSYNMRLIKSRLFTCEVLLINDLFGMDYIVRMRRIILQPWRAGVFVRRQPSCLSMQNLRSFPCGIFRVEQLMQFYLDTELIRRIARRSLCILYMMKPATVSLLLQTLRAVFICGAVLYPTLYAVPGGGEHSTNIMSTRYTDKMQPRRLCEYCRKILRSVTSHFTKYSPFGYVAFY